VLLEGEDNNLVEEEAQYKRKKQVAQALYDNKRGILEVGVLKNLGHLSYNEILLATITICEVLLLFLLTQSSSSYY